MGVEFPPQKFCDRCGIPDYEYPYTSYTGQIDQVTHVLLGENVQRRDWHGGGFLEFYTERYKGYPKRADEYCKHFTSGKNNKPVEPWWKTEIKIRSHTGKILKNGKFVDP